MTKKKKGGNKFEPKDAPKVNYEEFDPDSERFAKYK